jgi:hypothetical protein
MICCARDPLSLAHLIQDASEEPLLDVRFGQELDAHRERPDNIPCALMLCREEAGKRAGSARLETKHYGQ